MSNQSQLPSRSRPVAVNWLKPEPFNIADSGRSYLTNARIPALICELLDGWLERRRSEIEEAD